jgi:hypothetical protein
MEVMGPGIRNSGKGIDIPTLGSSAVKDIEGLLGQLQNEPRFRCGFSWYVSEHCEGDTILTACKGKKRLLLLKRFSSFCVAPPDQINSNNAS